MSFQPDRGAPASITLDKLISLERQHRCGREVFLRRGHLHEDRSGARATGSSKGAHLWLDLGDVKNLAEVTVNGKDLGVVWHTPYRVDVTSA